MMEKWQDIINRPIPLEFIFSRCFIKSLPRPLLDKTIA